MAAISINDLYDIYTQCDFRLSTDSRKISQGSLFVALKGEHFNGNLFATTALELGAKYALVDERKAMDEGDERFLYCEDGLRSVQELSRIHRRNMHAQIIAIGGSNGKTTTRELIAAVLSTTFRTHASPANWNNHLGVPLTLLGIRPETQMAVVELGTNHPGEMAELLAICEPDYGLITNIGKEHLEGFGSLEAVAREESELYYYLLKHNGLAFVNEDDDWLSRMASRLKHKVYYGREAAMGARGKKASVESGFPQLIINWGEHRIKTQLFGDFNADNVMAALCVGNHFDVSEADCVKALADYAPDNKRSQLINYGKHLLIADCYNANPSSMQKALEALSTAKEYRKVAVLGDMFELGEHAEVEHQAMVELSQQLSLDKVIYSGKHFEKAANASGIEHHDSLEALVFKLRHMLKDSSPTAILFKASRGMQFDKVISELTDTSI